MRDQCWSNVYKSRASDTQQAEHYLIDLKAIVAFSLDKTKTVVFVVQRFGNNPVTCVKYVPDASVLSVLHVVDVK